MNAGPRSFKSRPAGSHRYPSSIPPKLEAELDCFLEVQGASPCHAEEIAAAVAEEIDVWLAATPLEADEAASARELARQLRLLGWLVSVDLGGDVTRMMEQLEQLVAKAAEMTESPAVSGVRRKLTPPAGVPLAVLYGAEDDDRTVVKKALWDGARSANRVLEKD